MFKHFAKITPRNTAHIRLRGTAPALARITPPSRASASSSFRTAATLSAPLQLSPGRTTKLTSKPSNPYTATQAKTMSTSVSQASNPPPSATPPRHRSCETTCLPRSRRPLTGRFPVSGQHHRVGQDGRQDGRVQAPGQLVPQLRLARARRRVPPREGPLPPLRLVRLPLGAPDAHREEAQGARGHHLLLRRPLAPR